MRGTGGLCGIISIAGRSLAIVQIKLKLSLAMVLTIEMVCIHLVSFHKHLIAYDSGLHHVSFQTEFTGIAI